MRTRRSLRTERPARGALWGALALGVALVLVALRLFAPGVLLAVSAPALSAGGAMSAWAGGVLASVGASEASLARENAVLKEESAALVLENRALAAKVADVTALIGTSTPAGTRIAAGVVARPPTAPYGTLILAAGTHAQVTRGMEVLGPGGVPLGVVAETTASFARVRLFSAPGVTSDAWAGEGRVPLTLTGAGAGAFTAAVSQGAGIDVGDLVYLGGPGALPVGRVAHIAGEPSDLIETLAIASLVNPFSVTWVTLAEAPPAFAASTTATLP